MRLRAKRVSGFAEALSRDRRRGRRSAPGVHGYFGLASRRAGGAVLQAGAKNVRRCGAGQPRHCPAVGPGQSDDAVAGSHQPIRGRLPDTLLITDDMQMQGLQKALGTGRPALPRSRPAWTCSASATTCSIRSRRWRALPISRTVPAGWSPRPRGRRGLDRAGTAAEGAVELEGGGEGGSCRADKMLQARPSFALDHQAEAEIARRNSGGASAGACVADEVGDIGAVLSLDDADAAVLAP